MAVSVETSPLFQLEAQAGASWPHLRRAWENSAQHRGVLQDLLSRQPSPDTSIVTFGSLARGEMTSHSDLDWTLLIDSGVDPRHLDRAQWIARELIDKGYHEPGKSGLFGSMTTSHSLVHEIGGQDDTNANTTRRALLLLESCVVSDAEAWQRVRHHVLYRYLEDDRGLRYGRAPVKVPRFLLNDFSRYWRTITVDFVYKQRADAGRKWALRNAKLRMSRKLIFASGLLRCFLCHLDPAAADARAALSEPGNPIEPMLAYMEEQLALTPLELLARTCQLVSLKPDSVDLLFRSYDHFVGLLDDTEKRRALETMTQDQMSGHPVWTEVSRLSRDFQEGLTRLFFREPPELTQLTEIYGVF